MTAFYSVLIQLTLAAIVAGYVRFVGIPGWKQNGVVPFLIILFFANVAALWKYDTDAFHFVIKCMRYECPSSFEANLKRLERDRKVGKTEMPPVEVPRVEPKKPNSGQNEQRTTDQADKSIAYLRELVTPVPPNPRATDRPPSNENPNTSSRQAAAKRFSMLGLKIGATAACPTCFKHITYGNSRMPHYQQQTYFKEDATGRLAYITKTGTSDGEIVLIGRSFKGESLREGDLLRVVARQFGSSYVQTSYMDYFWFSSSLSRDVWKDCVFEPSDMGLGKALMMSNGEPSRSLLFPPRIKSDCGIISGVSTYGNSPTLVVVDTTFFSNERMRNQQAKERADEIGRKNTINGIKFQ